MFGLLIIDYKIGYHLWFVYQWIQFMIWILELDIVRTSFGLDPKTGLDSGPTSPKNEFVERGRKN